MARPTLFTHRKFLKLSKLLGSDVVALGHLEFIWNAAGQSGDPALGNTEAVELVAHWRGDAGELVKALTECRFIDVRDDGCFEIHDYWHHAPEYVGSRHVREAERRREKVCEGCRRVYFSTDPRSRYCCAACRTRGYRDRKRDGRDGPSAHPSQAAPKRDLSTENGGSSGPSRGSRTEGRDGSCDIYKESQTLAGDGLVTDRDGPLRSVTDRNVSPTRARAPTRAHQEEKNPPTPLERGAGLLSQAKRRPPREVRSASNTAWGHVIEGASRSYQRSELEQADPVLAATVHRLGGWNRFGQSTAIGTLKAPFRELYEQLLEHEPEDVGRAAGGT